MATIVKLTTVGFNVNGLVKPWSQIDFQWLAARLGAHSVSYLDDTATSLRVVCSPEAREGAITQIVDMLKTDNLFTARQDVSFIHLEEGLLLILFSDGLPHDMQLLPEGNAVIERVAYGERSIVLQAATHTKAHTWLRVVQDIWIRLMDAGIAPAQTNPYNDAPWQPTDGQILVIDAGMVIMESANTFTAIKDAEFHPPLPTEIIGVRYYAVGAYAEWPPSAPRGELTQDHVRMYLEIGRMLRGLSGGDFLELDAPITFHQTF